jgi:hypothetical protein
VLLEWKQRASKKDPASGLPAARASPPVAVDGDDGLTRLVQPALARIQARCSNRLTRRLGPLPPPGRSNAGDRRLIYLFLPPRAGHLASSPRVRRGPCQRAHALGKWENGPATPSASPLLGLTRCVPFLSRASARSLIILFARRPGRIPRNGREKAIGTTHRSRYPWGGAHGKGITG